MQAKRLAIGRAAGDGVMAQALSSLTGYVPPNPWARCDLANVTICAPLETGDAQVLTIYNPQSAVKAAWSVRVPVALIPGVSASWAVANASGAPVPAQLLPLTAADAYLRYAYYNYSGATAAGNVSVQWLAFVATDLPALGFSTFFLLPRVSEDPSAQSVPTLLSPPSLRRQGSPFNLGGGANSSVSNGIITLVVDNQTGLLSGFANAVTGVSLALSQELLWYKAAQTGQASLAAHV